MVDANTKITVRLNTTICPILCYEEYEMQDVVREELKETDKTEEEESTN